MATKSALVSGEIDKELTYTIWEPETDIRSGIWAISLQKVIIKFGYKTDRQFSFCVKTNFVEQNERDKAGNLIRINTCLGLFSSKGSKDEEIFIQNNNAQFFTITNPENDLIVNVENPFTKEKIIKPDQPESKAHKIACYFVYKRIL